MPRGYYVSATTNGGVADGTLWKANPPVPADWASLTDASLYR